MPCALCVMNTGFYSDVKTRRCGKCRLIAYCSAEHQHEDWPRHKLHCGKSVAPAVLQLFKVTGLYLVDNMAFSVPYHMTELGQKVTVYLHTTGEGISTIDAEYAHPGFMHYFMPFIRLCVVPADLLNTSSLPAGIECPASPVAEFFPLFLAPEQVDIVIEYCKTNSITRIVDLGAERGGLGALFVSRGWPAQQLLLIERQLFPPMQQMLPIVFDPNYTRSSILASLSPAETLYIVPTLFGAFPRTFPMEDVFQCLATNQARHVLVGRRDLDGTSTFTAAGVECLERHFSTSSELEIPALRLCSLGWRRDFQIQQTLQKMRAKGLHFTVVDPSKFGYPGAKPEEGTVVQTVQLYVPKI